MNISKEVIILKNLHPNEKAACRMAELVGLKLSLIGVRTKLVDLKDEKVAYSGDRIAWAEEMSADIFLRNKLVDRVMVENPESIVVEVHDSDAQGMKEKGIADNVLVFMQGPIPHYAVELAAAYVSQENALIREYAENPRDSRSVKYFTKRSDFRLSEEEGLCDDATVDRIVATFFKLAHR